MHTNDVYLIFFYIINENTLKSKYVNMIMFHHRIPTSSKKPHRLEWHCRVVEKQNNIPFEMESWWKETTKKNFNFLCALWIK